MLLFILFTLSSCSTTPNSLREPAAIFSDEACARGIKNFFDNGADLFTKDDLLKKNIILQKNLRLLEGPAISKALSDNSAEREQMEISYLLIKKQYPDFSEEQILDHYELLKVYCGI